MQLREAESTTKEYNNYYSVIQSSLKEIIGSKYFALNDLHLNFTEVIMTENKVISDFFCRE